MSNLPNIIGADACSDKLVVCSLQGKPTDVRAAHRGAVDFLEIPTNSVGLKMLLALEPDVVVIEPTGTKYIKFWLFNLPKHGVEVRIVHNAKLPPYRKSLDLPDKDDTADALALACYYFDYKDTPYRWVSHRDSDICKLRELLHRIEAFNRSVNISINRLKQVLTYEFPENTKKGTDAPLFWGWVAGLRQSKRYDRELVASDGMGISSYTKIDAQILYTQIIHTRELEAEIKAIMCKPKFAPYMRVFKRWQMSTRIAAGLLCQIFPFESLLKDGKPEIERSRGKNLSGKKTKKRLSLRRFKKCLGVAPVREYSGKSDKKAKKAGSALARKCIWRWTFAILEKKNVKLNAHTLPFREKLNEMKKNKVPVKKARSWVWNKAVIRIFYDLYYELYPPKQTSM
ncbi:MAG: transposase [Lyngbya sp.]|nr:transposase [Lyngbya sp.]